MEMFGEDSEEESGAAGVDLASAIFTELMRIRPFIKRREGVQTEIVLTRAICFVVDEEEEEKQEVAVRLKEKLACAHFASLRCAASLSELVASSECFDVLVYLASASASASPSTFAFESLLVKGGTIITTCTLAATCALFTDQLSAIPPTTSSSKWRRSSNASNSLALFTLRSIDCNTRGAIYWGASEEEEKGGGGGGGGEEDGEEESRRSNEQQLQRERALLQDITVSLTIAERNTQIFSDESYTKATRALQQHGICVFANMFEQNRVMRWGEAARGDMQDIVAKLLERGIDLFARFDDGHDEEQQQQEAEEVEIDDEEEETQKKQQQQQQQQKQQQRIENFHEMSMREALRCDIRNGTRMKAAAAADVATPSLSIRDHPSLYTLLQELMNPTSEDPDDAQGNWGRWNFEGKGPSTLPPITVGQIGAVMSLPGCADQTIHADTAHLFVHTQLPGHYYNLFMPAVASEAETSHAVGQTAFVLGTHVLKSCAHVMTQEGGHEQLLQRLVRPHLTAGDALLFDCRLLHFGLANQTNQKLLHGAVSADEGVWRPLLYVNYHQSFFHDPKNWDNRDRLF